jgi:peroxiredoxin Q/BCP
MKLLRVSALLLCSFTVATLALAKDVELSQSAPLFKAKNQAGVEFDLSSRKGKWTVLYFYPKAGSPGCTEQACAFRDSLKKIRDLGAEVYGVSTNTVEEQAQFHKEQKLNFDLLADPETKVTDLYGSKMPVLNFSKRWTFIINPELKIANIMKDVDTAKDAERVVSELAKLKGSK